MTQKVNPFRAIASNLLDEDGKIKSFSQQLDDYVYERMPTGDMFLVAESSHDAGVMECENLPIAMKQSTLQKVALAHEIPLASIASLPEWLRTYPLAMESLSDIDSLLLITDVKDIYGNDILIALHLEKEYRQININEIASIYGKQNLAYLIENTMNAGRNIYVNERTGSWLQHTRLPLPERVTTHLSTKLIIAAEREKCNGKGSYSLDMEAELSRAAAEKLEAGAAKEYPQRDNPNR